MVSVSVIIPCYNVGEFIHEAVDSVLSQTHKDFELLIVNDGSTDDTSEILDQYMLSGNNIRIISKYNGGLSSARNSGLSEASGEYILFLDGDDWLKEDALSILYNKAKSEDLDILIADTLFYYSDDRIEHIYKRPSSFINTGLKTGAEYFIKLKQNNCYAPMAINQIYKRDFLTENNLTFEEGLINEDELWTPKALCIAKRVNTIEFPFYFYRQRGNSIMNSAVTSKKIRDNLYIASEIINQSRIYNEIELSGWLWVKAYELYYRALTEYKATGEDLKTIKENHYKPIRLLSSGIPVPQYEICFGYLKKSYPDDIIILLLSFMRKVKRITKKALR